MDAMIVQQLKKGQGETNDRLAKLLAAQEKTNRLLEQLVIQPVTPWGAAESPLDR